MLRSYYPIYQLAVDLENRRRFSEAIPLNEAQKWTRDEFQEQLEKIRSVCADYGFNHTSAMAQRALEQPPKKHADILSELTHLHGSLAYELKNEAVFRVPPDRAIYYENEAPFGPQVAGAFPSCARDIRKAGNCYAFGEEDACVHHLMLVLERGLNALAVKLDVPYERTNWQNIINDIGKKLKTLPRGPDRDFYDEINSQFGFLKVAYRNHSEHAHDDRYDLPKALHIFNHVHAFMKQLASCCEEPW